MTISIALQFAVVLGAIWMGARSGHRLNHVPVSRGVSGGVHAPTARSITSQAAGVKSCRAEARAMS
jgi:hypothetical protein